jgi:protein-S-isoprenylcysteine O-methyltransferase Ste14
MTLFAAKLIWCVGFASFYVIRYPHERRARRTTTARKFTRGLDRLSLAAAYLGQGVVPAIYVFTDQPTFAGYPFQPALAWIGAALFGFALYLFHRAHRDLGRNWSISLNVRESHSLVTGGVYSRVRHPMYSAFLISAVAQALLLPNWIAGPAGLLGFAAMFFCRLWREERMMVETFGDEYKSYMARTSRIVPGVF